VAGRREQKTPELKALRALFEAAIDDTDPERALAATRELRTALYGWEGVLARSAVESGTSWDQIGQLLGITRQAAWSRLRQPGVGTPAIREARERIEQARRRR
jgi:hypothetical protein